MVRMPLHRCDVRSLAAPWLVVLVSVRLVVRARGLPWPVRVARERRPPSDHPAPVAFARSRGYRWHTDDRDDPSTSDQRGGMNSAAIFERGSSDGEEETSAEQGQGANEEQSNEPNVYVFNLHFCFFCSIASK